MAQDEPIADGTSTAAVAPPRAAPAATPAWLQGSAEPFVAWLHAAATPGSGLGVLFCPPFGWEEMSSYRPRRTWAQALAGDGIASVRFDLPGQGDAGGGPGSPARVAAWIEAVRLSADRLRHETGVTRVVAIGISLGGLLALHAAAAGAAIDDFVLWATPSRGKAFTRELKVFGRMENNLLDAGDRERIEGVVPDGWLAAGGYALARETIDALDALDASTLELPGAEDRHALLLGRDGVPPDERLATALRDQRLTVSTGPGHGYGRLLVEPQFARIPGGLVAEVGEFLSGLDPAAGPAPPPGPAPVARDDAEVTADDGTALTERFFTFDWSGGTAVGIITEPAGRTPAPLAAVLLGGTGHRIGPNRMWVELARRWAARGVATCRIDVVGAGDASPEPPADVPGLYTSAPVAEVNEVVAGLAAELGAERMLGVGLCAGAYWGLHGSLTGPVPLTPVMLNLPTLAWDVESHETRLARHYRRELFRRDAWRRLLRGGISIGGVLRIIARRALKLAAAPWRAVLTRTGRTVPVPDTTAAVLDDLRDQGTGAWLIFAGREGLRDELLARDDLADRWPNVDIRSLSGTSDLHTLRPMWVQRELHAALDAALDAELHAGVR